MEVDPFVSEAWFNLGQIYFTQEDYAKALEAYDYVVAIDPDDSFSYLQKAHLLLELGRYKEARDWYTEYAEMTQDYRTVYACIGECYEKEADYPQAIAYYRKALDADPEDYDALTGLCICMLEEEQYRAALHYIRQAIRLQPDYADGWIYAAEALLGLDDADNALQAYLKALECDPGQAETWVAIGCLYVEFGDYRAALSAFESAYRLDPEVERIHLFLAIAHFKLGHMEGAADHLHQAVEKEKETLDIFREICPEAKINKL